MALVFGGPATASECVFDQCSFSLPVVQLAQADSHGSSEEHGSGADAHGGGGSSKGGGSDKGGHDTGGHDSGSDHGGGSEVKGHGTKLRHQGHAAGQHGVESSHDAGADHFGGGSGVRGNAQVPEGVGRFGSGVPGSDTGRFRYWGGWTLPEIPDALSPADETITSTSDVVLGSGGGQSLNARNVLDGATRCEVVRPGMSAGQQYSGGNLLRLNRARGLVDPGLATSGRIASPFLMGNLQIELTKAEPNTELAGTYLGLMAKVPVTAAAVKQISFQLCGAADEAQVRQIADVAEAQRKLLMVADVEQQK